MFASLAHAVFVLGGAGSGARAIAAALGQLRGAVVAVPEGAHVFSRGIAPLVGNFELGRENGLNTLVDRPDLVAALRDLADDLLVRPAAPHSVVIDHSPDDVAFAALIAEVYPDAHLVCVVRDGRSVAAEARSLRAAVGVSRAWCRTNRALLAIANERVVVLRVEEVAADPDKSLVQLCVWLGAEGPVRLEMALPESGRVRRTRAAMVEAIGGDVLARLGYPLLPGPVAGARRALWRVVFRIRGWT
jgi:hypothetical protein